jgi:DNA-binding response OmpR family regulator
MASPRQATGVRLALIDDDSGLETVLQRRVRAIGWDASVLAYAAPPEQLAALRLHTALINPAVTGLQYVETLCRGLPGLAVIVISPPAPVADRVRGLRGGADDWMTKPVHPDELVARIEAVLRRRRTGELPSDEQTIAAGELEIRPDRFDAYGDGCPAGLSRKEYELLRLLAAAHGRVLEREDIYQRVWGFTMARGDRSVDVFVRKLRHKLESVSPSWRYVHTHFGVGYRFAAERADGGDPISRAGQGGRGSDETERVRRRTLLV